MGRRIVALAGRPESWLGLLLAWTLISALRSWHTPWERAAGTEALRWSAGIALALALGRGRPRLQMAAQVLTLLLGALVLTVLAGGVSSSGMVTGPFREHQLCASALLVLLPFSVALALAADAPRWRWGAQFVSLAAAVCLALTQTRSAWIGAGVAVLVFGGLWLSRTASPSPRRRGRVWVLPLVMAVAVAGAFVLLASASEIGRPLAARAHTLQAVGQDQSWQGRVQTWRGALSMVPAHPFAGWGLGRYPGAQWLWTRQGRPLSPAQRPSLSEQAHDFYLQTAVETGLVGLTFYLIAMGILAARCLQALRASDRRRRGLTQALRIATVSLLAGQAVDALASPSYQFAEVSLLAWAGLGLGMAALRRRQGAESTPALPAPLRRGLRVCALGVAAVTLVAQILPLGLLTPVEAYSPPPGYTLSSLVLTPSSGNVKKGSTVTFSLTATYSDGNGHSFNHDGNSDSGTDKTSYAISPIRDAFTTGPGSGVPNSIIVSDPIGTNLTITATFVDGSNKVTATSKLTVVSI